MIYCEDYSSYDCGCPERNEIESLRQQLLETQHSRDVFFDSWEREKQQLAAEQAEIERLKTVPMKYRRMAFNAQLQDENAQLRHLLALLLGVIKKFLSDNDPEGFGCACSPNHICGPCSEAKRQRPLYEALTTTKEQ